MKPEEIRKLLLAKKALPEGYGRSVVGGKELITAPSKEAAGYNSVGHGQEFISVGDRKNGTEVLNMPELTIDMNEWGAENPDIHKTRALDSLEKLYGQYSVNDIGTVDSDGASVISPIYHAWDEIESEDAKRGGRFKIREMKSDLLDEIKNIKDLIQEIPVYIKNGVLYNAVTNKPYYGNDKETNDDHVNRLLME